MCIRDRRPTDIGVKVAESPHFTGNITTTRQLNAPQDKTTGQFSASGRLIENLVNSGAQNLTNNAFIENEYTLLFNADNGDVFEFSLLNANTPQIVPTITIGSSLGNRSAGFFMMGA